MMRALSLFGRRVMAGVLAVGAVALAGCASAVNKPVPAPLPDVSEQAGAAAMSRSWSMALGAVDAHLTAAVVGTRLVLVSSAGALVEVDALSGQVLSRTQLPAAVTAGVGSDGVRHALVTADNVLRVIEAGQPKWQQRLSASAFTPPLVAGERVFVQTADRGVAAYDGATGRRLWSISRASDATLVLKQAGVLAAVGDTLLASHGGRLSALNPTSGQIKWDVLLGSSRGTNEVERLVDLVAGVARQGQTVCARAFQTAVACVDAVKGQVLWTRPTQGHTGLSGDEARIFGTDADGVLRAWARTDGRALWSQDGYRFRDLGAPKVWAQALLVGDSQGLLHVLDRDTGRTVQRHTTDGSALLHPPLLAGQTLVTVNRSGLVTGWHLHNEERKTPQ